MKKRDILTIIDGLDKINNSLIKNFEVNIPVTAEVLAGCQNSAIVVGNEIEKLGSGGEEIVRLLEAYCENIYQMSCQLTDTNGCKNVADKIQKQLEQIYHKIKRELPDDKKLIVFLPYKASMWDSLESVWKAADADPDCEAYVMPIPYFDKNPDGSLGEEHYEGNLFPEDIPITRYDALDLEECHPDIIYIHNPYDEYNYVTSVHPYFYSTSLKKFTDKLVYIPYFVCSEIIPDTNCLQKGVVSADAVIVQSDKIRDEYIKHFQDNLGERIPKDKFMALGSPKFDKVLHCGTLETRLTRGWKQRAGGRKIILYNTHLNTFLRFEEAAVKKIESVFDYFKGRDDALLLWRPHPLCKATLKAMRTDLYEAYLALEKRYLEEDIGILDESEDMYQAISVADGYYGDSSSVLSLFGVTGKPICIQNVKVRDYGCDEPRFRFVAAYVDKQSIYFVHMDYNVLFVLDRTTGCVQRLGKFPQSKMSSGHTTDNIGMWKGKLWTVPAAETRVFSYDLTSGHWDVFELPKEWLTGKQFTAGKQVGRYYYAFGTRAYGVIKLDMETGEMHYIRDNFEHFQQVEKGGVVVCRQDCCQVEEKLYAACLRGNIVLAYDMQTEKIEIHQIGDSDNRYITVTHDGSVFWLTTINGEIIRWNSRTDETRKIDLNISGYRQDGTWAFGSSLYAGGYVWFFAYSANMSIRVNVQTGEVEKVYEFIQPYNISNHIRTLARWYEEGKVCFVDAYKYSIVQIDMQKNIQEMPLPIDEDFQQEFESFLGQVWNVDDEDNYRAYLHKEGNDLYKHLGGYLDHITMQDKSADEKQQQCFLRFTKYPEGNAGEMIHRKMTEKD